MASTLTVGLDVPRRRTEAVPTPPEPPSVRLPKNALTRLNIGQSFAEYDPAILDPYVYVQTPAIRAALNPESGKYFFIGRRGTGKTALRTYCQSKGGHVSVIVPEIFSPFSTVFNLDLLSSSRKGPFRSLVSVLKRTLIDELLILWHESHSYSDLPEELIAELAGPCRDDFDERALKYIANVARMVKLGDDSSIAAINQPTKSLTSLCKNIGGERADYTLKII